jgi:hypothetical protein
MREHDGTEIGRWVGAICGWPEGAHEGGRSNRLYKLPPGNFPVGNVICHIHDMAFAITVLMRNTAMVGREMALALR